MSTYSQNFALSGLETLTIVIPIAGNYTLSGKIKLPRLSQTDPSDPDFLDYPSAVVCTIQKDSSTIFTTTPGSDGFSIPISALPTDTFTIALSSGSAQDEVINAVSAVISLG